MTIKCHGDKNAIKKQKYHEISGGNLFIPLYKALVRPQVHRIVVLHVQEG